MRAIVASVGLGGENRRQDVMVVQSLLQSVGVSPGPIDGRCGRRTIGAIEQFQREVIRRPDGRIDVRGPTMRQLVARAARVRSQPRKQPGTADRNGGAARKPDRSTQKPSAIAPDQSIEVPLTRTMAYWQERIPLPGPSINAGLICPISAQLMALIGDPSSQRVKSLMATESVGPFRATGLKPALSSLRTVLTSVRREHPTLYPLLKSNGMHLLRQIRNSRSYSNHSWGIAIDFTIAGETPNYGQNFSLRGLTAMVSHFHHAGWYWGGGYRSTNRKDAMHFECGLALVKSFNL